MCIFHFDISQKIFTEILNVKYFKIVSREKSGNVILLHHFLRKRFEISVLDYLWYQFKYFSCKASFVVRLFVCFTSSAWNANSKSKVKLSIKINYETTNRALLSRNGKNKNHLNTFTKSEQEEKIFYYQTEELWECKKGSRRRRRRIYTLFLRCSV